jgi:transcriptional regulator with XRE-family HTH domain
LGFTQEQLAYELDVTPSTVARWERGEATPRAWYRPALAKRLGISLAELADLLAGEEADESQAIAPGWLNVYVGLEQSACRYRGYEPTVIPGLLQTPAYADAILRGDITPRTEADLTRLVRMRMDRQKALTRRPHPLDVSVVVDEVALRRVMGGRDVMARQLEHLADAARCPNVTLQVMPIEGRSHSVGFGAFVILGFPWASGTDLVYQENRANAVYLEAPHEVKPHVAVFEHLAEVALSPWESIDLIRTVAKEMAVAGVDERRWRKSSYSDGSGACVEVTAVHEEDVVGVRNSRRREAGFLAFPRSALAEWIEGCKAGEFDDLM